MEAESRKLVGEGNKPQKTHVRVLSRFIIALLLAILMTYFLKVFTMAFKAYRQYLWLFGAQCLCMGLLYLIRLLPLCFPSLREDVPGAAIPQDAVVSHPHLIMLGLSFGTAFEGVLAVSTLAALSTAMYTGLYVLFAELPKMMCYPLWLKYPQLRKLPRYFDVLADAYSTVLFLVSAGFLFTDLKYDGPANTFGACAFIFLVVFVLLYACGQKCCCQAECSADTPILKHIWSYLLSLTPFAIVFRVWDKEKKAQPSDSATA